MSLPLTLAEHHQGLHKRKHHVQTKNAQTLNVEALMTV